VNCCQHGANATRGDVSAARRSLDRHIDRHIDRPHIGTFYLARSAKGDAARNAYAQALAIREQLAAAEPDRADYQHDLAISYERAAALAGLENRTDEARTWFERATRIIEQLAAAEPARADYQVHIVNNLVNMAPYAGDTGRALLERAASILRTLDADRRLAPIDRGKLDTIVRMLAAIG
jgi:hypothetical protein